MRDLRAQALPILLGAIGLLTAGIPGPAILVLPGLLLYGGLELSVAEMAVLVGPIGFLVHWALARFQGRPNQLRALRPGPIDWAVVGLLLAGLLSLLPTEYPRQSLRELRWLLVEPILL